MDMCAHGLKSPSDVKPIEYYKKPTAILSSFVSTSFMLTLCQLAFEYFFGQTGALSITRRELEVQDRVCGRVFGSVLQEVSAASLERAWTRCCRPGGVPGTTLTSDNWPPHDMRNTTWTDLLKPQSFSVGGSWGQPLRCRGQVSPINA